MNYFVVNLKIGHLVLSVVGQNLAFLLQLEWAQIFKWKKVASYSERKMINRLSMFSFANIVKLSDKEKENAERKNEKRA